MRNYTKLWDLATYDYDKERVDAEMRHNEAINRMQAYDVVLNLLYNIHTPVAERPPLSSMFSGPTGRTAVIVGNGPSAWRDIKYVIKAYDSKYSIIATDITLGRLCKHGIKPDMVISEDILRHCLHHFDGDYTGINAGISMFQHPLTIKTAMDSGMNVFPWCPINPFSMLSVILYKSILPEGFWCLRAGTSVVECAIEYAIMAGFSTIILTGVDLCWSTKEDLWAYYGVEHKTIEVKTESGEMAYTVGSFIHARNGISFFPILYPDVHFVDTSGGIVIGFERQNIKGVLP